MKIGIYKGIHVEKPGVTVTEEDILKVLKKQQRVNSVLYSIDDRPAQSGDRAVLHLESASDTTAFSGKKQGRFTITLGSDSLFPGFDEQVAGKKIGESFDITVTVPEQNRLNLPAGSSITFHAELLKIGVAEYPAVDDDFARDFSDYQTLADWKEEIRTQLEVQMENQAYEKLKESLLTAAIASSDLPVDADLEEELAEELFDEFRERLMENHMTFQDFCRRTGNTEQTMLHKYRQEALRNIQEHLLLHAVAENEGLTVTASEIRAELEEIAGEYGMDVDMFADSIDEDELDAVEDGILVQKSMDFIIQNAVYE